MKSLQNTLAGVLFQLAPTPEAPRCEAIRPKGPRRQEVEAQHGAEIHRALSYQLGQDGLTEAAKAALWREAEARLGAGPDFTHYRSKSRFAPAVAHGMTVGELAKLRYAFNSLARKAWEGRDKGKHRGAISRTCSSVFNALAGLAQQYDRLFPSLERIAHLAQCSRRSVVTAIADLERLGFITKHRRLRMVEGPLGRKAEQDTNAYELHLPRVGIGALLFRVFKPESECKNRPATATEVLSYLVACPDTWGSPFPTPAAAACGDG